MKLKFLYKLEIGSIPNSFGISIAIMVGLPDDIVAKADKIS
jgi:DNA mismatch repair ATPase MutS